MAEKAKMHQISVAAGKTNKHSTQLATIERFQKILLGWSTYV